jgi:hypothetical protein
MAKVGSYVTDPKAGSYCQITLDSGEKIVVNHDKEGRLAVEVTKWMGFGSDRFFSLDLTSAQGKSALAVLTREAPAGSAAATPLGALVNHLKECRAVGEVKARCAALLAA